jgi:hypothetical protein
MIAISAAMPIDAFLARPRSLLACHYRRSFDDTAPELPIMVVNNHSGNEPGIVGMSTRQRLN